MQQYFLSAPPLHCSMSGCSDPESHTYLRCQACSVPPNGNCLHHRVCLMLQCLHGCTQAKLKAKRGAATTSQTAPPPSSKKPRVASGLSTIGKRSASSNEPVTVLPLHHKKLQLTETQICAPRKDCFNKRYMHYLIEKQTVFCQLRPSHELRPGLAPLYNPILWSQGCSEITPIDIDKLSSAIHSVGFGVLGPEEVELNAYRMTSSVRFI